MTTATQKWTDRVDAAAARAEYCTKCGSPMREMLRADESTSVFIWFECARQDCLGRKLKQYSLV